MDTPSETKPQFVYIFGSGPGYGKAETLNSWVGQAGVLDTVEIRRPYRYPQLRAVIETTNPIGPLLEVLQSQGYGFRLFSGNYEAALAFLSNEVAKLLEAKTEG